MGYRGVPQEAPSAAPFATKEVAEKGQCERLPRHLEVVDEFAIQRFEHLEILQDAADLHEPAPPEMTEAKLGLGWCGGACEGALVS